MSEKVLILGSGIGGLTAALELVRRGFEVKVLEREAVTGGKSRSMPVPESGTRGRADLPGEHGFRFFPGFYRHLPDSLSLIPFGPGFTCLDNLVDTADVVLTRFGRESVKLPARFPRGARDFGRALIDLLQSRMDLEPGEAQFFATRIWQVATSCRDRREQELEAISWWDFIEADRRSPAYQSLLGEGLSRSLVAARAKEASARTIGQVQVHLLAHVLEIEGATDRILNGPTSEVLLGPWRAEIERLGGTFHPLHEVTQFQLGGNEISGVVVKSPEGDKVMTADHYISALPIEVMARLVTPAMARVDPALGGLAELAGDVRWMNGIQFYLKLDFRLNHGHTLHVDTPWALTSISQSQFWPDVPLRERGDGAASGVLSVVISDWDQPGLNGKKARDCATRDEIAQEVWAQLTESLRHSQFGPVPDDLLHSWFLDPAIRLGPETSSGVSESREPLFINRPNTWAKRPDCISRVPKLYLAADYVRTHADLACMECASEAAKRTVTAILAITGSRVSGPMIHELGMPFVFKPFRGIDQVRFELGLPWDFDLEL